MRKVPKIAGGTIATAVAAVLLLAATRPDRHARAVRGRTTSSSSRCGPTARRRASRAMQGGVPYVAKIVHLFFDMDAMIGAEFERGLAELKALAER